MTDNILEVKARGQTGKGPARQLRMQGYIPAVMYGHKGNMPISVHSTDFLRLFEEIGEHAIITLSLDKEEKIEVIVKDFQLDPVKRDIIHVDFLQIKAGQLLRTEIPVKIVGTSKGIKKGGILEEFVRDIEIECFPKNIPGSITIDITELDIGDSLHIRDLTVSEEVKVIANPEQVVLTIGTPSKLAEPVVEEKEEEEAVPAEEEEGKEEAAPEEKNE
jgi:large subunit ribosomal protein L25